MSAPSRLAAIEAACGLSTKEAAANHGVTVTAVHRALSRMGLSASSSNRWAKDYDHCRNPRCKYTKGGVTSRYHQGNGLCVRCYWSDLFAKNPKVRAGVRAAAKRHREQNYDKIAGRVRMFQKRHPGRYRECQRKSRAVARANRYARVFKGDEVTAPFLNGQYRVLKTYIYEGDAVCDVDNGYKIHKRVPLDSLTVVTQYV